MPYVSIEPRTPKHTFVMADSIKHILLMKFGANYRSYQFDYENI